MYTTVTVQQINHFAQFGWIEFEDFLQLKECSALFLAIQQAIAKRLQTDVSKLTRFDHSNIYLASRDLWRDAPVLKQHFCSQRFASTAASLSNKQPLQLACDQWIPKGITFAPLNLQAHLSFQNLACGCSLMLEGEKAGSARFFHPDRLPLFGEFAAAPVAQILIAYGTMNTVYVYNQADSSNAFLKQFGYSFGDRLDPDRHPLCKNI